MLKRPPFVREDQSIPPSGEEHNIAAAIAKRIKIKMFEALAEFQEGQRALSQPHIRGVNRTSVTSDTPINLPATFLEEHDVQNETVMSLDFYTKTTIPLRKVLQV